MSIRKLVAAASLGALAIGGLALSAGAAGSTFTVSDSSITEGQTVTVHLTTPCLNESGAPDYGNVILSSTSGSGELSNQETKGDHFFRGTGTFSFPGPGTYTITRFCDATGQLDQVTVTVAAKPAPTTTTTTSTSTAPTTSTTTSTTTAPKNSSSTTSTTSTTVAPKISTATTTTTVATSVAGVSQTRSTTGVASSSSPAAAATAVSSGVSYTG